MEGEAPGEPVDFRPGDEGATGTLEGTGVGDVHGDVLITLQADWYVATVATDVVL